MNASEIAFREEQGGRTQNEVLRDLFLASPGMELSLIDLAAAIGAFAVHSRVADLRKDYGMKIVNRTERKDGKRHSFYTYVAE